MAWQRLLVPLNPLYSAVVRCRRLAYHKGWFTSHRLPVPVVSVGNLTFGGTGKTPTVIALVRDLVRRGRHPAVLSRGYGRRDPRPVVLVGPDHGGRPDRAGDEPVEMASRLPGVPIVVDSDRVRGGLEAIRCGADVLLLDDGFQHLRLRRDLDLVLLDAGDPWGGGRLPPCGRLREPVATLRRASAVLVTKLTPQQGSAVFESLRRSIHELAPGCPVLASTMEVRRVRTPQGVCDKKTLDGKRLFAFAGIGRPQGFIEVLEQAGATVAGSRWFDDHHHYGDGIKALLAEADGLGAMPVTTTKDAVKLPPEAPIWIVEAETVPADGDWDRLWALLPGSDS